LKSQHIGALGNFHKDWIVDALMCVVFRQFDPQTPGLDPDSGITLRIESQRSAKNLSGDLILLESHARMIEGVFGEIA
jgi:hypothetical protein